MRLFYEENYQVRVNPEMKLVPEFKKVITRDHGTLKHRAKKEFSYIYFVYDHKSPYSNYAESERILRVCRDLDLLDGKGAYTPDAILQSAIDKYLSFMITPTVKSLISIREGLLTSSKLIDRLRTQIENALEDEDLEDIDPVVRSVTRMLEISEKLPKAIDNILNLEEKILKEQTESSRIKGGGEKGIFED